MTIIPVTVLDYVSLIVMGLSMIISIFRGFVREVLAIFAWVGAGIATYVGFPIVDPFFSSWIPYKLLGDIVGASSIFLTVLILLSLIAHHFSSWIQKGALNGPDRMLGLFFGAARGVILLCCAYILIAWGYHKKGHPNWLRDAAYLSYLKESSDYLLTFIPESARQKLTFDIDAKPQGTSPTGHGLIPDIGMPDKKPKQADKKKDAEEKPQGAQPITHPEVVAKQVLELQEKIKEQQ